MKQKVSNIYTCKNLTLNKILSCLKENLYKFNESFYEL